MPGFPGTGVRLGPAPGPRAQSVRALTAGRPAPSLLPSPQPRVLWGTALPWRRHPVLPRPPGPASCAGVCGTRSLTRGQAARLGAAVGAGGAGRRVRVGVGEPGGLGLPGPALVVAGLDGIGPAPAAAHPPARRAPRGRSAGLGRRLSPGGGARAGETGEAAAAASRTGAARAARTQRGSPSRRALRGPLPARPSPPAPRPAPSPPLLPRLLPSTSPSPAP